MANQFVSTPRSRSIKRPFSVTLLAWVVLILALLGWLRLFEVLRQWQYLQSLTPTPLLVYLAVIGLIWGTAGTALVWGLVLGRAWAPRLMRNAAIVYSLYYWADRLFIADPSAIQTRWPFALGLNAALITFTFWVLTRPKTQLFFQKAEI
jgi:hypothetical protein